MEPVTLTGNVNVWKLGNAERKYMVVTLPFKQAREILKARYFSVDSGEGEQRGAVASHVSNIRKDMENDKFSPTPAAAGLTDASLQGMQLKDNIATVVVTEPLPLLDGGQRFGALEALLEKDKQEVLDLPITFSLYLDTRNKENFLNAQKGRPVDKAHMLSLQVGASLNNTKIGPYLSKAMDIARILYNDEKSPFYKLIKFDTQSKAPYPISTLCAKGASDLATSLVGLAKLAEKFGKDTTWAANAITTIYQAVKDKAPELLQLGKVLTPPPEGSRGSATMWIGLGTLLAYHWALPEYKDKEFIEGTGVDKLVETAKKSCDHMIRGNFAGPKKRSLMGDMAYSYYAEVNTVKFYNEEIPLDLVEILSYSAFNIKKPKKAKPVKAKGKPGRKPKAKTKPEEVETKQESPPVVVPQVTSAPQFEVIEETPAGEPVAAPWENDNLVEEGVEA
jgi:hypothetical protein